MRCFWIVADWCYRFGNWPNANFARIITATQDTSTQLPSPQMVPSVPQEVKTAPQCFGIWMIQNIFTLLKPKTKFTHCVSHLQGIGFVLLLAVALWFGIWKVRVLWRNWNLLRDREKRMIIVLVWLGVLMDKLCLVDTLTTVRVPFQYVC